MTSISRFQKDELDGISKKEGIDPEKLARQIECGRIVILNNSNRNIEPLAVGEGTRVKVNANIGMSPDVADEGLEIEKARTAVRFGADSIMDLSIGGDTWQLLKRILKLNVPVGTVPIYQAALDSSRKSGSILDMDEDQIFQTIERHARAGVDFMTIHSGITKRTLEVVDSSKRVMGIVSRGGALLAKWMRNSEKENPLYKEFDYLIELIKDYNVALSLGDALRPGCIADSTDQVQIEELLILGELVEVCRDKGVGAIVEGPGHVPINEIEANVLLQKRLCKGAPFYVLGPIVTDISAGYDHISAAIGGAIAAMHGADFLCYVTPSEHLALPDFNDVRDGVMASRIAAHAADIARGIGVSEDLRCSQARASLDWEAMFNNLLDSSRANDVRRKRHPRDPRTCTMCGDFCSIKQ